jgi:flagellar biosynthetic protein FliR
MSPGGELALARQTMDWLDQIDPSLIVIFSLVLARISGLVATAPFLPGSEVPMRVRALLVLAIALLITPSQWARHLPTSQNLVMFSLAVLGELCVGGLLGLGLQFFFGGVQIGGLLISQTSGLTLADVFNPALDNDIPLFSHLMQLLSVAIFLALGGHRLLVAGLLATFQSVPPGSLEAIPSLWDLLTALVAQSFGLGLRIAAPSVTALLLVTIVLGLVSRTLPQLNIMSFGFGANALVTLAMLSLSLSALLWILQDEVEPLVQALVEGIQAAIGAAPIAG